MKRIFSFLICAGVAVAMVACAPMEPKKPGLGAKPIPDPSTATFTATPDPELPYRITFEHPEAPAGEVAYWDFADGGTGIGNKVTHDFAFPGEYNVTAKLANASGIYADKSTDVPVDVEKGSVEMFLMDKTWVWDQKVKPNFGNSPPEERAPTWTTSLPAADTLDVYDDSMIFNADGTFSLDTGAGGKVLVNEDATKNLPQWGPASDASALRDFVMPADADWGWNVVPGSPNPMLTFTGGGFPSYVASKTYETDKYEIMVLDAKTLYLRVAYDWGAFYMRFTHPEDLEEE